MPDPKSYFRYWGKTAGDSWHPLPCHCLDVAAVAAALLEVDDRLRARLERLCPFPGIVSQLIPLLLALHDVGKFSPRFQAFKPGLLARLQSGRTWNHHLARKNFHHTHLGQWLWTEGGLRGPFTGLLPFEDAEDAGYALDIIVPAVMGHHGLPSAPPSGPHFEPCDLEVVTAFAERVCALFPVRGQAPVPGDAEERAGRFSWDLAGLTVLCDWIGSNEAWFPACPQCDDLETYFRQHALPRAREAVRRAGVIPPEARGIRSLADLFPGLDGKQPTPLQAHALSVELPDEPQLHIFEDLTGSGKTEAGLILAVRLMSLGLADGFTFALPTMATANSMYRRLAACYDRLFVPTPGRPSLMLAHGARRLNEFFLDSVGLDTVAPRGSLSESDEAEAACAAWLADDRRKALLAPAGAATLDQCLLGALPVAHQCMRLYGLGRNVLIADEVHSYDPYVTGLLERLLGLHAARGGSAVLLSATLPRKVRARLEKAFRHGASGGRRTGGIRRVSAAGDAPDAGSEPYPSAGLATSAKETPLVPISPAPWAGRELEVGFTSSRHEVLDRLAAVAVAGGCAAYVLNTVDDALAAWRALRDRPDLDADRVLLLHARFALGDRLAVEERLMDRFGKVRDGEDRAAKQESRAGWVVVGTQVLEMSLDYDVDFMAVDLCPVDALLQRAGRLQRLDFERPPDHEAKRLLVHAPVWADLPDRDWYGRHFEGGQWVYRLHSRLWLTMRELRRRGTVRLPDDVRGLVEAVYGVEDLPEDLSARDERDVTKAVPESLLRRDGPEVGRQAAELSMAHLNALSTDAAYSIDTFPWTDAEEIRTRLGDEGVILRLARVRHGRVGPWVEPEGEDDQALKRAWALSEVRVRRSLAKEPVPPVDVGLARQVARLGEDLKNPLHKVALLEERGGQWRLRVRTGRGEERELAYNDRCGLHTVF